MALFGTLNVLKHQAPVHQLLNEGIHFLQTVNMKEIFSGLTPGKKRTIEIKGKKLFAIFQTYNSKSWEELKFEGHQKYIDIQFIYSGQELIGVTGIEQITKAGDYNTEKDIHFSEVGHYSKWLMMPGDAAIFFPEDMHAPSMSVNQPEQVQKVVVKIAV